MTTMIGVGTRVLSKRLIPIAWSEFASPSLRFIFGRDFLIDPQRGPNREERVVQQTNSPSFFFFLFVEAGGRGESHAALLQDGWENRGGWIGAGEKG